MRVRTLWLWLAAGVLAASGGCVRYTDASVSHARGSELSRGRNWTVPGLRLQMVYVAPGSFLMGSEEGRPDERPVHEVRLSRGFWIGRTEVTQAEYRAVMGGGTTSASGQRTTAPATRDARVPVETVSWDDAVAFCAALTAHERALGRLPLDHEYRLPTEAEWEYAARGGARSGGYRYSGANSAKAVAWCAANSGNTVHPVAQMAANELRLYDMSGNVCEWCLDAYAPDYYAASATVDPVNLSTLAARVFRGGCWGFPESFARTACRSGLGSGSACDGLGFRIVLGPPIAIP